MSKHTALAFFLLWGATAALAEGPHATPGNPTIRAGRALAEPDPSSRDSLEKLVSDLDSRSYRTRELALRELKERLLTQFKTTFAGLSDLRHQVERGKFTYNGRALSAPEGVKISLNRLLNATEVSWEGVLNEAGRLAKASDARKRAERAGEKAMVSFLANEKRLSELYQVYANALAAVKDHTFRPLGGGAATDKENAARVLTDLKEKVAAARKALSEALTATVRGSGLKIAKIRAFENDRMTFIVEQEGGFAAITLGGLTLDAQAMERVGGDFRPARVALPIRELLGNLQLARLGARPGADLAAYSSTAPIVNFSPGKDNVIRSSVSLIPEFYKEAATHLGDLFRPERTEIQRSFETLTARMGMTEFK